MPGILKLHNLSCHKPGGDRLFSRLDSIYQPGIHGIVGANGSGKSTLLRTIAGEIPPASGHISIPHSIGFFRQMPPSGGTLADLFGLTWQLSLIEKAGQGKSTADELNDIDWQAQQLFEEAVNDADLHNIRPEIPLQLLSGGEQTKARLAALFLKEPDLLLLDEPSNNLDVHGKDYLLHKLRASRSIILVVSHDRQLLNEVQTVTALGDGRADFFSLSFADFCLEQSRLRVAADAAFSRSEYALKQAKEESHKARERQDKRNRRGKVARTSAGAPKIALDRAKGRAEKSTGKISHIGKNKLSQLEQAYEQARQQRSTILPLDFDLPPSGITLNKTILRADALNGGADTIIYQFNLTITGPERIAICGDNGSGKTTLLQLLSGHLSPISGSIRQCVTSALLDQHVSLLDSDATLLENFRRLNPEHGDNVCYAALARLGFRNEAAKRITRNLSGGEKIRAGLACTIASPTPVGLLMLDEPTNHLDLDAIAALEDGLNAYDGALLIVSHDSVFLENIAVNRFIHLPQSIAS